MPPRGGESGGSCPDSVTSTNIANDVWFDWTATSTGVGRLNTCGQTSVDTKVAVWEHSGSSSCPLTAIACNTDACGLQSMVTWPIVAGEVYTIQLGNFPGAAPGTGTFSVAQLPPPPCGQYDSGSQTNQFGLTAGGEMGWIHAFDCLATISGVETAYGLVPNGNAARIALYEDTAGAGDPNLAATLLDVVNSVVVNAGTNILNTISFTSSHVVHGSRSFVLASAVHGAGEFPGPMDTGPPTPHAWVVGATTGGLHLPTLAANTVPPLQMQALGFPGAWRLRAIPGGTTSLGTPSCPTMGATCPCGIPSPGPHMGCPNGLGTGAQLNATVNATGGVVLTAVGVSAQPGLFFMADNLILGGAGVVFGDGLRCCGGNVVRLEVVIGAPPQPTMVSTTVSLSLNAVLGKCLQYWYRTPGVSGLCGW